MQIAAHQNIPFKANTQTAQPSQTQASTTPETKKDSVNFGKNDNETIEYEKSHFLTKVFGGGGLALGVFGGIGATKMFGVPSGIGVAIGTAIKGLVLGLLADYCINKTVENTTKSIKINFSNDENA